MSIWPSSEDLEISLEANPTSIDKKNLRAFLPLALIDCLLAFRAYPMTP